MQTRPLWLQQWVLAESAFGGSLEAGSRFHVGAFGRNLFSVALKMFSRLVYQFIKKFCKFCTFSAICNGDAAINCITFERKQFYSHRLSRVILCAGHVIKRKFSCSSSYSPPRQHEVHESFVDEVLSILLLQWFTFITRTLIFLLLNTSFSNFCVYIPSLSRTASYPRFQILTAFWDIPPCTHLYNFGLLLRDYSALYSGRLSFYASYLVSPTKSCLGSENCRYMDGPYSLHFQVLHCGLVL